MFIVFKFETAPSLVVSFSYFCIDNWEHLKIFGALTGVIGRRSCQNDVQVLVYSFCMQYEFSFPTFLLIARVNSFLIRMSSILYSFRYCVLWHWQGQRCYPGQRMGTSCFVFLVFLGCTFNVWERGMLYWHHIDSVCRINEHHCINFIGCTSLMFLSSKKSALFTVWLKTLRSYWDRLYAGAHMWHLFFLLTDFG
jgi:hypothetical protein